MCLKSAIQLSNNKKYAKAARLFKKAAQKGSKDGEFGYMYCIIAQEFYFPTYCDYPFHINPKFYEIIENTDVKQLKAFTVEEAETIKKEIRYIYYFEIWG